MANNRDTSKIDRILKHANLSVQDFREVEVLGNDAFDYIRECLLGTSEAGTIVNGLSLLIRLATQFAQDSAGSRLPEVFEVSSAFLTNPLLDIRKKAINVVVAALWGLRDLKRGLDAVGGKSRVQSILRAASVAEPATQERERLEAVLVQLDKIS